MSSLGLPIDYHHYTCLLFTVPALFTIRFTILHFFIFIFTTQGFDRKIAKKLAESTYYFIQYAALYIWARSIIQSKGVQPFNFDNFFADYPDRQIWSSNEHKYFMTEMSNYIVALLFLPMETRKRDSDLTIMLVHHITSITLIYSGY